MYVKEILLYSTSSSCSCATQIWLCEYTKAIHMKSELYKEAFKRVREVRRSTQNVTRCKLEECKMLRKSTIHSVSIYPTCTGLSKGIDEQWCAAAKKPKAIRFVYYQYELSVHLRGTIHVYAILTNDFR